MTNGFHLARAFAFAAAISFATPCVAASSDSDHREVSAYALTEAGLAKFTKATKNLASVPGACKDEGNDDGQSGKQSIDEMVAEINATAGAQAAIRSAGLTTREYVVFMFSMLQNGMAAWALSQPGGKLPPGVSKSNVDFYNKHEAALAALGDDFECGED
jgi:hypothetical protein